MSESAPGSLAAIEVTPSYSGWSFILGLCKSRVVIDGFETTSKWDTTTVTVAPGAHQVEAWTVYLFYSRFGRNGLVVNAVPGTLTRVSWRAPMWAFSKGKVAITEVVALPPGFSAPALPVAGDPYGGYGGYGQPPVPGMTAPAMGLTPNAPWTPTAPYAAGRMAPVAPAGWHPDPAARHELRWFDGSQWTNHVSDDGVASTDEGIPA